MNSTPCGYYHCVDAKHFTQPQIAIWNISPESVKPYHLWENVWSIIYISNDCNGSVSWISDELDRYSGNAIAYHKRYPLVGIRPFNTRGQDETNARVHLILTRLKCDCCGWNELRVRLINPHHFRGSSFGSYHLRTMAIVWWKWNWIEFFFQWLWRWVPLSAYVSWMGWLKRVGQRFRNNVAVYRPRHHILIDLLNPPPSPPWIPSSQREIYSQQCVDQWQSKHFVHGNDFKSKIIPKMTIMINDSL